ncbi:nuclear transport factor 2 family protein [Rhizobium sp. P44RR-XXIV]|uniref:nuclear transport factor 2 family protein n=1 Tax=Rhizobium sp. P44RR-XXIV TaxID=1921145 RepID=UPI0009858809|nr:nuclear transport factor 2 family protein [Rhizobium sp. P44RR-XXIV]TIX89811.1 nuclear transport factor 2 family protein [Rhizobium sp. P44RR-XXIV]
MNSLEASRCDTVRRLFAAYVAQHPDIVEPMLAPDFTFSSPRDDHIDRRRYFEHCWPREKVFRDIHIEHLIADGGEVIVSYRAEKMDGGSFRNVELIRFAGDRIAEVNVYFGRNI